MTDERPDTTKRRRAMSLRLMLAAPISVVFGASGAQACTDPANVVRYFSYEPPERHGDTPMLRVQIVSVDRDRDEVMAQLDGAFARLSRDGSVRIELSSPALEINCVQLGPTDGPVFVIGTLRRTVSGELSLVAIPTRSSPAPARAEENP